MDIEQFIASGILETYVLGETNEQETSQVQAMAKQYPEIQAEILRIENTMEKMALENAIPPPAFVKSEFMQYVKQQQEETHKTNAKVVPMQIKRPRYFYYAAAATLLLCASVAINVWLYQDWRSQKNLVASMQGEKQLLLTQAQKQEAALQQADNQLAVLRSSDYTKVVMSGTDLMPTASATVYWNNKTGSTWLDIKQSSTPPNGKQYQLWAIVNGVPVSAGVFDSITGALIPMPSQTFAQKPSAFAVTIEKSGGSETPTLDQMVMAGSNG